MVSETVRHHHLRSCGFLEETRWNNVQPFFLKLLVMEIYYCQLLWIEHPVGFEGRKEEDEEARSMGCGVGLISFTSAIWGFVSIYGSCHSLVQSSGTMNLLPRKSSISSQQPCQLLSISAQQACQLLSRNAELTKDTSFSVVAMQSCRVRLHNSGKMTCICWFNESVYVLVGC
ncbi:hypothetical protein FRX31_005987 [Thalictrum thalictroides]|uniref:Uncharacterized protein n=1 Tax=Thalictrum thalictroides TaxID=46969 RepID=A0A7J6X3T3_THATH|nr:hypothetical protein FRX31_005987 [Thalictrum thalictroides]